MTKVCFLIHTNSSITHKVCFFNAEMDVDSPTGVEETVTPFVLGIDTISDGNALEADDSVYIMRHELKIGWSCLSFDILRDNLGDERQRLPTAAYVVAGSQADRSENNAVSVFKLSSLHRTQTHGLFSFCLGGSFSPMFYCRGLRRRG